ncbi:fumarylacetoacetate hydrolase family protein [Halobellus limi]|uniref:2-keto-4-pentenoate hydratase/2-oxohepta-3-ene-1,7-dioic acid hydratase (Catechol pathway) n=1 Tax=Halobellus limi TaxID=699433 RepID=A0A1H6BN24_9EURY|nr:fumarylacetoacetate hydrolase family protein [Halobellus limi]QCC49509.1 FAA hydrolase family protein [Halobellus limi]SEG62093.1 2-keto-4-pentenoate hydratase/2-oxohepta-3-ene-1,7-dioic acid hydratase (catechol pathway) [Halobellus limi]
MRRVRVRDDAGSIRNGEWIDDEIVLNTGTYDPSALTILPPVEPTKIVCVGLNYADHAAEEDMSIPDRPMLFLKPPNTISSHGDTVVLPRNKDEVEFEAEIGIVIGTQCRNVDETDAMDVVAGFTCVDDLSNRDDQRVEQNWVRGKAFDNAAPIGPVVAGPEHVPEDARVQLAVNGEKRQSSSRSEWIFSLEELVSEVTQYMTLERGDIISTGTPAGVGPLEDGDTVEVTVEGVGTLEHTVKRE